MNVVIFFLPWVKFKTDLLKNSVLLSLNIKKAIRFFFVDLNDLKISTEKKEIKIGKLVLTGTGHRYHFAK